MQDALFKMVRCSTLADLSSAVSETAPFRRKRRDRESLRAFATNGRGRCWERFRRRYELVENMRGHGMFENKQGVRGGDVESDWWHELQ